jgi:UDP-N-acetyl-D-galactosamine dehydrogenase
MRQHVSVIGLGCVGLPVATTFAKAGTSVASFDIDNRRVAELAKGHDRTGEVQPAELHAPDLRFTANVDDLRRADFHIVTMPTPIDARKQPDLQPPRTASIAIGKALKKGDIVVYESTVYPGVTEDVCIPVLERASGLKWKVDFNVGYSPERINPGDRESGASAIS